MATSVPYNTGGMVVVTHVYPQQGAQSDSPALPQTGAAPPASSRLQKFLKGEPAILGTVQIMTGIVILLFGIVGAFHPSLSTYSGIPFWGAIIYITAGSLTLRAYKKLNRCLVRASLGMNVISTVTAALGIIVYSLQFITPVILFHRCPDDNDSYSCNRSREIFWNKVYGTIGVMLVLSVLEFIVSIYVSAFACKAICSDDPQQVVYISNQIPTSVLTSPPSATPLNTSEIPLLPSGVFASAHSGNAEDLPPKYTPVE
ncbi:hypothetical protein ACEWY4_020094 [Coilia grayii]|uniref:Membrane-spanning 4-domains subfamily A member 4A-like n=1 Tax=Coilia grayii TaxID=363190 RepID=A0ABD1JEU0_9TELE